MAWGRFWSFFVSLLVGLCSLVQCKVSNGEFSIPRMGGFHYLSKFGCSIGECPWQVRVRLVNPWKSSRIAAQAADFTTAQPSVMSVRVLLDETWEAYPVRRRPKCGHMNSARVVKRVTVPLNGEWSEWLESSVTQVIRPHVWYFILEDCKGVVAENAASHLKSVLKDQEVMLGDLTFQWEFRMLQVNGSQFSYELFGTFGAAAFHALCYLAILVYMALYETREMKKSGKIHVMVQMLNVCVLTQMASSLLHLGHLLAYSFNGRGIGFMDGVAETLTVVSQIALSSVLIFIAMGYSLNVPTVAAKRAESTGIPVVIVVTIFHIALVSLDKFNADPRFKFHAADGFLGLALTLLRVVLWGGFVSQCVGTLTHPETPQNVRGFLRKFAIAGSLNFLAYPVIFGVTCAFAPYLQHRVLSNGIFLMQLFSMIWLCSLFLRKGEYFKISELSQSYLPGGYLSSKGTCRLD